MSGKEDEKYLREIMAEEFSNWTDDPKARPACERLAARGICRVVDEDPRCWRVYQSREQREAGRAALSHSQGEKL